MSSDDMTALFLRSLSAQAYGQLIELKNIMSMSTPPVGKDVWICNEDQKKYSSIKMYKDLMCNFRGHKFFNILWVSASRLKHKILFWLALHDRPNTKALLRRKGFL